MMSIKNYHDEFFPLTLADVLRHMAEIKVKLDLQLSERIPVSHYFNFDGKWYNRNNEAFKKFIFNSDNETYKNKEIKGLYVFAETSEDQIDTAYVGISKTIMRRIYQHAFSNRNETATLLYLMARKAWEKENDRFYDGLRSLFPLAYYLKTMQNRIRSWTLAIAEIDNNFELTFAEQYMTLEYKPYWNSFETH